MDSLPSLPTTVLYTSTACEALSQLLAQVTSLIGLSSVRAQEEIEHDDQAPHKHDTTQEHKKKAPDVDVLTIGIGWLQKGEKQGNTKANPCTYATPHKLAIHGPPDPQQLYSWYHGTAEIARRKGHDLPAAIIPHQEGRA
jgi:hypothetical protein